MPRAVPRRTFGRGYSRHQYLLIVLVAVLAVSAYFVFSLYSENQSQAQTIAQQSSDIAQKTGQISDLTSNVKNLTSQVSSQAVQISGLNSQLTSALVQVDDLGNKLGLANQEIAGLKPKIRDYYVVGVDSNGNGVVVPIEVKIVDGTGSVSASINNVDLLSGAQESIRDAAREASNFAKAPISDKDITVTFVYPGNDVVTVDGPSAGGAITTDIIAALENRTVNTKVLMTGTINTGGTIGPIGGQQAKAQAAANFGATTFLVPPGQGVTVSGLDVVEISSIDQAVQRVLQ